MLGFDAGGGMSSSSGASGRSGDATTGGASIGGVNYSRGIDVATIGIIGAIVALTLLVLKKVRR